MLVSHIVRISMIATTLRVNEIFTSIQGEGYWTGMPCTFIRLQGCNLKCAFCDSKSTWDLNGGTEMSIQDIVNTVSHLARHIVITGGEPLLQENVVELVHALIWANYDVYIETNGVKYNILKKLTSMPHVWITISPKYHRLPSSGVLLLADEVKWIIRKEEDLWIVDEIWEELAWVKSYPSMFFLQPVSQDPEATKLCVEHVIKNAIRDYRLSIQLHKYIGVK